MGKLSAREIPPTTSLVEVETGSRGGEYKSGRFPQPADPIMAE